MQPLLSVAVALAILTQNAFAHLRSQHFPGYGFGWYDPPCAFACEDALSAAPLSCTDVETGSSSPECRATNVPFLTSLAYCMQQNCDADSTPAWQRELFWHDKMTGDVSVVPMMDYATALMLVNGTPTVEFNSSSEDVLNTTVLVPDTAYLMQYKFNVMFDHIEMLQARYW